MRTQQHLLEQSNKFYLLAIRHSNVMVHKIQITTHKNENYNNKNSNGLIRKITQMQNQNKSNMMYGLRRQKQKL